MSILACTDGSLYSTSVYHYAAWASKKMDDRPVHVLHLLDPHHEKPKQFNYTGRIGVGARKQLLEELVEAEQQTAQLARKRGIAILEDAREMLEEMGVTDITADQWHGKLSEELSNYDADADLIILGKRGNDADFETGHLGSNLERVMRTTEHPLLIASVETRPITKVLIAFDGSKDAHQAITHACESGLLKDCDLSLLLVAPKDASAAAELLKVQEDLIKHGFPVTAHHKQGEVESTIADFVDAEAIDLVVLGARGNSMIRKLIVGGTTVSLVQRLKIPALVIR